MVDTDDTDDDRIKGFPVRSDEIVHPIFRNMRLLDYFAGEAIGGILAATVGYVDVDGVAENAYAVAEAMLLERDKIEKREK